MLLATGQGSFPPHHPDLCAFARDPVSGGLPDRYQLYLALSFGPIARFTGVAGRLSEQNGRWAPRDDLLEVARPPFSCVLSIDEERPALEAGNITAFTDLGIDQRADVEIQMICGFGHTIFPLDYRSKAALLADRAENQAA